MKNSNQKEEAKTVEGILHSIGGEYALYDWDVVLKAMKAYSSQQNTALMEENARLIKAIEYALNKVYTLEHTQNGVKKYIRVDLLKAKTTLEEALKPKQ